MIDETIDLGALRRLLKVIGGNQEDLAELMEDYASDAPTLIARMRDGAGSSDWVTVFQAAHTLKSNARDMGAQRLSDLCAALEEEARDGPVDGAEARVAEIAVAEEAARRALCLIRLSDLPSG